MITGPASSLAARAFNAALPPASQGTAGTPGFARVLSATDPQLQAPKAAPPQAGPATPQPPATPAPESPTLPKSAEPPPAHNPGRPVDPPHTVARGKPAQGAATLASTPPVQTADAVPDADSPPAQLSTLELPIEKSKPAPTSPNDPPPSLQSLLATLPAPNEPAPTLAWGAPAGTQVSAQVGAQVGAQTDASAKGHEWLAGLGAVRGSLHLTPDSTTALPGATTSGQSVSAASEGTVMAASLTEGSSPFTLPSAAGDAAALALPGAAGVGIALPQPTSAAPGALPTSSATPPSTQAQIAASPGSPAFAPELGAQISTFVRLGVERAQLQLHPAEMGPVTVQILVEGAAAQVRLWAEQPGTRAALEQAMPTLAGQLRESGLTLTGGGVFEQAQQSPEQAWREARHGAGETRGSAAEQAEVAAAALATPTRRRGVVDLIA